MPHPAPAPVDSMIQIGKDESKGFEFEVVGQITDNWNVVLNYAFNESERRSMPAVPIKTSLVSKSPMRPATWVTSGAKYSFKGRALRGLGVEVGGNFVTERFLSLNQAQTVPGYELLNAAIYYKIDKFQIQFNLNNVLDKTYWVGGYDYLRLFPVRHATGWQR